MRIQPQVNIYSGFPGSLKASEIQEAEFRFLRKRRRRRGIVLGDGETPLYDGAGLALSGGGIKSATFCLGVVQELAKRGIFRQMDYLSTVSGGGYLGTFISSYLGSKVGESVALPDTDAARIKEAFEPEPTGRESTAVRHLRNHSKYLLHGGLWGKLNIAGLLASGVLTNLMMILPIPLLIACALGWANKMGYWDAARNESSWAWLIFAGFGVSTVFLWLFLPLVQRLTQKAKPGDDAFRLRSIWEFFTMLLALGSLAAVAVWLFPDLLAAYEEAKKSLHGLLQRFAGLSLTETQLACLIGAASILLGASGFLVKNVRARNLILKLFILSGPLFYALVIFFVTGKFGSRGKPAEWPLWAVVIFALLWLCWSVFAVSINMLAMHRYYRSRLCECYLVQPVTPVVTWWTQLVGKIWRGHDPEKDRGFGPVRRVKLSSIGESMVSPYHLINGFINLPASKNRNLRGRAGDFYLFSRDVCGSPSTGYVKTTALEDADPHLDLGTAMAISGAAANTNMGWRSLPNFRFIMTLLNVRLGYWVPNLKKWNGSKLKWLREWTLGLPYLLAEMGGRIQENMNFLNLSDGGHIENLGAYELLRRRCKFIISVDGGGNRDIHGGDLQRLERYAAIDFGIEMKYDLAELQADADGMSRAQAILVKVLYPAPGSGQPEAEKETGWMIYLRPGITGIEPTYLLDHWRTNPLFPFESLAEQFFSEEQFEGYRCLGERAAGSLFREDLGTDGYLSVEELFKQIATHLLPDNDSAFVKKQ